MPPGKQTDFFRAVQATPGRDGGLLGWVEGPGQGHARCRFARVEELMHRPPLQDQPMIFDGKRLIFGGFVPVIDLEPRKDTPMNPTSGGFIWYEPDDPDANVAAQFYGAVVGWNTTSPIRGPPAWTTGSSAAARRRQCRRRAAAFGRDAGPRRPPGLGGSLYVHAVDAAVLQAIAADGGQALMPDEALRGRDRDGHRSAGAPFYDDAGAAAGRFSDVRWSDVFDPMRPQHVRWNELQSPRPGPKAPWPLCPALRLWLRRVDADGPLEYVTTTSSTTAACAWAG